MIVRIPRKIHFPVLPLLLVLVCGIGLGLLTGCVGFGEANTNIKVQTFRKLERVRLEKKNDLIGYFHHIHELVKTAGRDPIWVDFFQEKRTSKSRLASALEYEIDTHFVEKYGDFYDLLFVDITGFVFHSIRMESDYHTNLFAENSPNRKLAELLKKNKQEFYVDYEFYLPSDEPAAFFATPVKDRQTILGWIILQCPINRVNTILTDRQGLGRTGEVYLVNKDRLMLSESRFMGDSTSLKLKVDTVAVREALLQTEGRKIISDYRGKKVFSSFEKIELFNTSWIIIAEIDESEVITEWYKEHRRELVDEIVDYLAGLSPLAITSRHSSNRQAKPADKVDMNEFAKARPGTNLSTRGVTTCTAVAIVYPDKFGYLTHYSPLDNTYAPGLERFFYSEKRTNFLTELLRRIIHYEVYPFELNQMQFFIVASHANSFQQTLETFLERGVELTDVRFLYNPEAMGANILLDVEDNSLLIEWFKADGTSVHEEAFGAVNLENVVKKILNYDQLDA